MLGVESGHTSYEGLSLANQKSEVEVNWPEVGGKPIPFHCNFDKYLLKLKAYLQLMSSSLIGIN